jgi:hypothetical protein
MRPYKPIFVESKRKFKESDDRLIYKLPDNEAEIKAIQIQYAFDNNDEPLYLAIDIFYNQSKTELYRYSWVNGALYLSVNRSRPTLASNDLDRANNIYDYLESIQIKDYQTQSYWISLGSILPNPIKSQLMKIDFMA